MERNIDNAKYVMGVVTDMEDTIKTFKENNIPEYLDEEEANFHPEEEIDRVSTDDINVYRRNNRRKYQQI